MIVVIDYGASNLLSVAKAIESLGYQVRVTSEPELVSQAEAVILPGVGAAGDAMEKLRSRGMIDVIRQVIADKRPFLGICLGLQVLLTTTEESGGHRCLDLIPGKVVRLPETVKVPHMGWNQVKKLVSHPVFEGIPDEANFYFVHSYYAAVAAKALVIGETDYGITFGSVLAKDNLVATQFHPEKSGAPGLTLLHNFLKFAGVKK